MKLRGGRATRAVPAAALALLLLTGCSDLTPGTAAVVNGSKITNHDVDELAAAQCVAANRAAKSGQSTTMAISRVKAESLGLLMDAELSRQYGKDQGITPEPSLAGGFFDQLKPGITPLPSKARAVLTDFFESWGKGRAILVQAGARSTGQTPSLTNLDQLLTAGLKDRESWLKKADITTDARYSPNEKGYPGASSGSVSRATSSYAKDASKTKPDANWVKTLPPSQKCG